MTRVSQARALVAAAVMLGVSFVVVGVTSAPAGAAESPEMALPTTGAGEHLLLGALAFWVVGLLLMQACRNRRRP